MAVALCALALAACDASTPAQDPSPPPTAAATPAPAVTSLTPVPTESPPAPPTPDAIAADPAQSKATLVQLADPLDEPEFYCVDVPGFGASLNLDAALMAHTCKPGADDEIFVVGQPGPGNLSMPAYNRCMEAEGAEPQAQLHLQECSDSAMQQFASTPTAPSPCPARTCASRCRRKTASRRAGQATCAATSCCCTAPRPPPP